MPLCEAEAKGVIRKWLEVQVRGGLAPRMPDTFYVLSGCTGAGVSSTGHQVM